MTLSNQAHSPLFPPQKCDSKVPGPCHFGTRIATSNFTHVTCCCVLAVASWLGPRQIPPQAGGADGQNSWPPPQVSSSSH